MKVTRAKRRYNPTTGERKYYRVELLCECGNKRQVDEEELIEAAEKDTFVKFKCSQCQLPRMGYLVHRQWFRWHNFKYDLFPTW